MTLYPKLKVDLSINRLNTLQFIVYTALFSLFLSSCATDNSDQASESDYNSKYVDYITSYTSGVISVATNVKIKFTRSYRDSLKNDEIVANIFSFSPSIDGKTYWQDAYTLVFEPSSNLTNNQSYRGEIKLKGLVPNIEKELQSFKFSFQTLQQNYEVKTSGIKLYDKSNLKRVKLEGTLQTADYSTLDDIIKMASATQNGNSLAINWQPSGTRNQFSFIIEEIERTDDPGSIELIIDGSAIGVDKKLQQSVEIPSLSDFKVVSANLVHSDGNYISILFSDPLDERQNLVGLVNFTDGYSSPRLVVSLNELKVFPTQDIHGNIELIVNSAVQSINGSRLKTEFKANIQFTQLKPAVRFLSSDSKSIMPDVNNLVLPFEAVGLNAVDIRVVKIFEDNVLQYLQVNSLGNDYELQRVGRPIVQKTITLSSSGVTDLSEWNKFTLDLNEIISSEPGAIYQIEIGFQQKFSLYNCAGDNEPTEAEMINDDWQETEESSNWDQYENYYLPGFNWQDRENPCTISYYGRQTSISKIMLSSNFGIIAKKRDGGKLNVYVTNMITTQPLANVTIQAYDFQQQLMGSAISDKDGMAEIVLKKEPFILVAQKDGQKGYLKLDDGSTLSLSNFDVSGTEIRNGLKGFIYGERGVWRPADTVHLGFILEDMASDLPVKHPVIMELYNPAGQMLDRKVSSNPTGEIYRFDFITSSDAPTGSWQAKVKVGGAIFNKTIRIETIKPNRLKVNLEFDKERFSANDESVTGDLNVRWLTGATANGLKAEFELLLTPAKTTFDGYHNYLFDDVSKDFYSERTLVYSGRIDANGKAKVSFQLTNTLDAPGALNAKLFGKVYEEGGDFSISNVTVPYYPYTSFIGINTPDGDKRGMLVTDKDHKIKIASIDADGKPVARENIKVKLFKLDWRWWWDNSYDDISNYVSSSYITPYSTSTVNTSNGKGEWVLRVNQPDWGRFYLQVEDPVSGHSAGKVIYIDWPGWAGKGQRGGLDGASMLDFSSNKPEYKVGEDIIINVPTTSGNRILASIESGSQVLESYWVATQENSTEFTFKATDIMAPNIYVHLTMIQPHGQKNNDLPIRLYGVQSLKVVNSSTVLEPLIKMPDQLRPEEQFTVEVSEKTGREMAYTIAIVDEGLLDITNFKTPDPWSSFFTREALGIKTWDVYDDVIGAYSGQLDHLLAVGGDAELKPKEEKKANRFKPVVKYLGPFLLPKGAKKKHKIIMPQYIGSVKTMVIAASNGAYGNAERVTPVKQPMMLLATLPRVAGPGEIIKVPVNIFTTDNKIKNVSLSIETNDGFIIEGEKTKSVSFNKAGDKMVYFALRTKEALGIGKVKINARSGSTKASYGLELNILPRNPESTIVADRVIDAGATWQTSYKPVGISGLNRGSVEISTLPSLNIEQRLAYLIKYPHGCIEQTTSAVFAQLYLDKLTSLSSDKKAEIQRNIEAGVGRLVSFQVESGGLSYWPGNNYANDWGTNYAGHFIIEAKNAGYAIPANLLSNWIRFQTKKAKSWSNQSSDYNDDIVQAYRLYTLAIAGKPVVGAMNRMRENNAISIAAKWRLALAYARAGYDKQALKIIEGLPNNPDVDINSYRYTFGSDLRDQAMILETLLELDKKSESFTLLMDIAKKMGNKDLWMSTQTTAYCFIATAKYAEKFALAEQTNVSLKINTKTNAVAGTDFVNVVSITNADKEATLVLANNGQAPVFARVVSSGTPIEGTEKSINRNIRFRVSYINQDGRSIDVTKLTQGTNFKAVVKITNPGLKGTYNQVALTQIFPSGWEIINTRLDGSDNGQSIADYVDIRDDRVMHYFDLKPNQTSSFTVLLNAAYQGKYYLPSVSVGAMYDNSIFGNRPGKWIEVVGEGK